VGKISAFVALLLAAASLQAVADDSFQFRLSPGSRLVGTRAMSSGSGEVSATLSGNTLSLDGKYEGLLAAPATAQLAMGSAPGVRGPKIADLAISSGASGTVSGKVKLDRKQLALFHKGGLYIEIDSAAAPEGDLWGWVLPFQD
jgi:CHRD domain